MIKTIIILLLVLWLILGTWEFSITINDTERKIEYNGLLWVCLDYYTIQKYNSDDTLMTWIKYTKTLNRSSK